MTDTEAPDDLTRVPRLCYYEIWAAADPPTKADLTTATGYCQRTITEALGTLVAKGYIQGVPRRDAGGAHEYTVRE
jgi:DNA-binding transcriptional MocR family regulator